MSATPQPGSSTRARTHPWDRIPSFRRILLAGGILLFLPQPMTRAPSPAPIPAPVSEEQIRHAHEGTSGSQSKPLPPIEARLEPLGAAVPGEMAQFRLVVIPRAVPRELRIEFQPAPSVEWLAGERSLVTAGGLGVAQEHLVSVRVPTGGRHPLHVRIEMTTTDGKVWSRGVGVALGRNPRALRVEQVSGPRGESYLQYPAAPADKMRGGGR